MKKTKTQLKAAYAQNAERYEDALDAIRRLFAKLRL